MAEFAQSAASRAALHDAARSYLRSGSVISALAGTSDKKATAYKTAQRRVQRWTTTAKEQRKPSKAALAKATGKVRLKLDATLEISETKRHRKGIIVDLTSDEAAELLGHALGDEEDQDEAWQDFFDDYVCPAGQVEDVQNISFS